MVQALTVIASLITIFQLIYVLVVPEVTTAQRNVVLDLGTETRAFIFAVSTLAVLFIAYRIAYSMGQAVGSFGAALFTFGLNVALVVYAASVNYRLTWGPIEMGSGLFLPDPGAPSGVYLIVVGIVTVLVTRMAFEEQGWSFN